MCHQYYGFTAVPGGGLFVLEDPFGDSPRLADLLADATVAYVRLVQRVLDRNGVDLPDEDFHRIALWLDRNSEFFGAYENTEAQARGEIVPPSLD